MKKIVITYGLISAAISAIMWIIIALFMQNGKACGDSSGMIIGYASMLLSIFIIYFAMKNYRDNIAGGTIKFGKAFLIGLYISIIFAVCYVITWMIIRNTMLPDFWDNYIAYQKTEMEKLHLSPAAMAEKLKEMDNMRRSVANPWMEALFVFAEPWPVAILVTLVSAFIVSRKAKITILFSLHKKEAALISCLKKYFKRTDILTR